MQLVQQERTLMASEEHERSESRTIVGRWVPSDQESDVLRTDAMRDPETEAPYPGAGHPVNNRPAPDIAKAGQPASDEIPTQAENQSDAKTNDKHWAEPPTEVQLEVAQIGLGRDGQIETADNSLLRNNKPFSPSIVTGVVAMIDGAIVFGSGLVMYFVVVSPNGGELPMYFSVLTLNTILTLTAFHFAHLYDFEFFPPRSQTIAKVLAICASTFLVITALVFALNISSQFSRLWLFCSFFVITVALVFERNGCYSLLHRWARLGRLTRNVAIVGAGEQGQKLVEFLERINDPWLRILGVFDDRIDRVPKGIGKVAVLGDLDQLVRFTRENRVDYVLVALPWAAEKRVLDILHKLMVLPIHIHLSPDITGFNFIRQGFERLGGIPFLRVSTKPLDGWNAALKIMEDKALAAVILAFVLPLMLVIAAAIKLFSPGPVLFRQKRYGFNNQVIEVWKFRTMYHDPDPNPNPNPSVPQATRNDSRVTWLGTVLRRTSLDELPQLINVLKGDMSIIGPRPHAVPHNEYYARIIDKYLRRHRVKPGITGWAQVNGLRGATETPEKMAARVNYDLYYIENWSLLLDIKIIFRTIFIMFRDQNAY